MKEKFLILDNVISKSYLEQLVNNIFDYNWKFTSNLTYDDDKDYINSLDLEYGFNAFLTESQKYFMLPLILKICDLSGIKITTKEQVTKITPRLQAMLSSDNQINDIHVDSGKKHYVIIYYPHNIDGETILYNETTSDLNFSKFNKLDLNERMNLTQNFTILERIQPRENRALIFNGDRYHASSSPSKGPRCIINVNIDFDQEDKGVINYS